jgi:hypothetical protein
MADDEHLGGLPADERPTVDQERRRARDAQRAARSARSSTAALVVRVAEVVGELLRVEAEVAGHLDRGSSIELAGVAFPVLRVDLVVQLPEGVLLGGRTPARAAVRDSSPSMGKSRHSMRSSPSST